jgi:DNA-binding response OmpR family regulator
MNVLLIEPDTVLANVYKQALERVGHKVMRVASAQSGVTVSDIRRPDVVIMELQLATHSGVAFLYEFRSYADWLHIPVIIHSVIPPAEIAQFDQAFQELNISSYLYKPHTSLQKLVAAAESAYAPVAS